RLRYADQDYDDIEEELHQFEDEFIEEFGKDVEAIFSQLHQKYCPDTEVLSPLSYLAKSYHKIGKYEDGTAVYDIPNLQQGLIIDSPEYNPAYLVIIPNPVRILLTAPQETIKEEVWVLAK
ncbi:MAG: hypothetical protein AAFU64_12625, partial [Bacteroidota bacterium]